MKQKIRCYRNISSMLTLGGVMLKQGRHVVESDLSFISKACLLENQGQILWLGEEKKIPKKYWPLIKQEINLDKKTVLPGFVECHTHSLFAGSRAHEFEMRQQGVSYQEIAKKGGGILSTVSATRKASKKELQSLLWPRVQNFLNQGVTTLEIKSGYGLDEKTEIKMLQAIAETGKSFQLKKGPQIVSTFLGAHSLPKEFSEISSYLESLIRYLPKIKKYTSRVDIWIEKGFFLSENSRQYLQKAKELGFDIIIHADQLTLSGGTELAIELQALSADHVIQLQSEQIKKLSQSSVTAVLLPLADLYMKCAYPPARKMIDAGVRVALATDFNPGTCPSQDISLVGLLARLEMKMSLAEVIAAYTVGAAYALGLQNQIGSLAVGKNADFVVIDQDWTSLFYSAGKSSVNQLYVAGNSLVLGKHK